MKILTCLLSLCLASLAIAEDPADLMELRQAWEKSRTEALQRVDKLYFDELEELKKNFVKAGNLDAARVVDGALKGGENGDNEPEALTKLRGARSKSLSRALKPLDKQYWIDLKKLKKHFQQQGSLSGVDATEAEIKKVLAAYKKPEPPKKKAAQAEVAKGEAKAKEDDDPKDEPNPEAAAILEKAKGKDGEFQYNLAARYLKGDGVEKDEKVGVQLLHLAAEQNHAAACASLGFRYAKGQGGLRRDKKRAAELIEKAIAGGQRQADFLYAVAKLYLGGQGLPKDEAKGIKLLHDAHVGGYPHATNDLGSVYWKGVGVAKDEDKAAELFAKAAVMGIPWSMGQLNNLLGKNKKERAKLAVLFTPHAEAGSSYAQYILGKLYRDGDGVARDKEKAAEWFRKAADQGHKEAKVDLELLK